MSENITISFPAAAETPLRYVTKITCGRYATTLLHTSDSDETSFEIEAEFGDKIHQETRAIYEDRVETVVVKDIWVPFSDGPTNLQIFYSHICYTGSLQITVGGVISRDFILNEFNTITYEPSGVNSSFIGKFNEGFPSIPEGFIVKENGVALEDPGEVRWLITCQDGVIEIQGQLWIDGVLQFSFLHIPVILLGVSTLNTYVVDVGDPIIGCFEGLVTISPR